MAEQVLARAAVRTAVVDAPTVGVPVVRVHPRLVVIDGFASDDEVAHVLALGSAAEAAPWEGSGAGRNDAGFAVELAVHGDEVLEELGRRVEGLVGARNRQPDTVRFRRYRPGEAHPPHVDVYEIGGAVLAVTAMLCLTTPAAGGETLFPSAAPPVAVVPRAGRLVAWADVLRDGSADRLARHEGTQVVAGEKATATTFVYLQPDECRSVVDGFPAVLT